MTNPNERLRILEVPHSAHEQDALPGARLTRERAERVFKQRKEMLVSIKANVGAPLYEALTEKINYENAFLLMIIESDAKAVDAKKRMNKVLKTEYFVQKPLDVNIL